MTSVGCVGCEGTAASVPAMHLLEGTLARLPLELVFEILVYTTDGIVIKLVEVVHEVHPSPTI